jgi:hypothetical protein
MSMLQPSTEHWHFLNIFIIMGMHIYELWILAWQWHSMQYPKTHHMLIQVVAVISSCLPWINSIPTLKSCYYYWSPNKTMVWNEQQKIGLIKAIIMCNFMGIVTAATAVGTLCASLSYQKCNSAHQIHPNSL